MAAPLLVSRTPTPNETNVYLNKYIEVVFNQSLSAATVNDNTCVVYRVSDFEVITCTVTLNATTNTITIVPEIVLDQNTQYNAVIVGADETTLCLKNAANENLASSITWYFTTGTSVGDQADETAEEDLPPDPVADPPASRVLETRATSTLSIKSTSPENYKAGIGNINGDYETVHWDGPITITFDRAMASGAAVLQDWISLEVASSDGDPATVTHLPSGYLSNSQGSTLTYTFPTFGGNNYSWRTNNEITVTIDDAVASSTGITLGSQYRFMLTTAYRPYYCTIQFIRAQIGSFIREIPDDTIARNIYFNSIEAYNIANTIYSQYKWDMDSPPFAAKRWVCCKTMYDLLYAKLLDMAAVGPGQMKRLGDFTIQESTDIQAGVKGALQKALDCANAWMKLMLDKYRRAKSKLAVKGVASPATPPMRGVRTWTLETGRDTLGANKTLTRRIKSPGIYSEWS